MRRLLTIGYCAVYLAFGFVAGVAHVHEAADHHEEMRGLHVDHAHLGETSGHGPGDHDRPAPSDDGEARLGARHVGHHEGDVLYLTVPAQRSLDPGLRVVPTMIVMGATIAPPSSVSVRRNEMPNPLRGPPKRSPTPPRAPPA